MKKYFNSCTAAVRAETIRVQLLRHTETVLAKHRKIDHLKVAVAVTRDAPLVHEPLVLSALVPTDCAVDQSSLCTYSSFQPLRPARPMPLRDTTSWRRIGTVSLLARARFHPESATPSDSRSSSQLASIVLHWKQHQVRTYSTRPKRLDAPLVPEPLVLSIPERLPAQRDEYVWNLPKHIPLLKIYGDGNCSLRAIAVELHDPNWSVRRGKEGQPFYNSASKPDRAMELDRVESLRDCARAGWLKEPEQERKTQLEGLKDVYANSDEFLARLGTMGSYIEHCALYALAPELQRPIAIVAPNAQTRSRYVQIVGDNFIHNDLIPLLFNGVNGAGGHHDLVDPLWLRDHLASQGIRRWAFRSRCARDSSKAQWRSEPSLLQQVVQAQTPRDLVDDKEGERIKLGNKNALKADLDNAVIQAPLVARGRQYDAERIAPKRTLKRSMSQRLQADERCFQQGGLVEGLRHRPARISEEMAGTCWHRIMCLVADADRKADGDQHGESICGYLELRVLRSWLVDSVASTTIKRKNSESPSSSAWLDTLVKAVRAVAQTFLLHDRTREASEKYLKELRSIRVEAGRRTSELAQPRKRGDLFVRDHLHPASGYFLAQQILTFEELLSRLSIWELKVNNGEYDLQKLIMGTKEAVDADAHEAKANRKGLAVAEYKRALLVTYLFLWSGDRTQDTRGLAVNWDIGDIKLPHGGFRTVCFGHKVGKPDSARSLPLAPTVTLGRSSCPKSQRCSAST